MVSHRVSRVSRVFSRRFLCAHCPAAIRGGRWHGALVDEARAGVTCRKRERDGMRQGAIRVFFLGRQNRLGCSSRLRKQAPSAAGRPSPPPSSPLVPRGSRRPLPQTAGEGLYSGHFCFLSFLGEGCGPAEGSRQRAGVRRSHHLMRDLEDRPTRRASSRGRRAGLHAVVRPRKRRASAMGADRGHGGGGGSGRVTTSRSSERRLTRGALPAWALCGGSWRARVRADGVRPGSKRS
jgi:hypothetical protein